MSTPSTQTAPAAHAHTNGASQPQANSTPTTNGVEGTSSPASQTAPGGQSYPEQKHAGAVGYGPNYQSGPGFGDKVAGLKEEVKGKVLHKPDVVQHGHDLRTGELKRKEKEADENDNPFHSSEDPKEEKQEDKKIAEGSHPPGAAGGNVHKTEKGAIEQAASVAPEGSGAEGHGDPKMIG